MEMETVYNEILQEEVAREKLSYIWMSFKDETGFLGVIIIKTYGPVAAMIESHDLGINPGGEVVIIMEKLVEEYTGPIPVLDRLLDKEELINLGFHVTETI